MLLFIDPRIVDGFSWRACFAGSLVGARLVDVRVLITADGVREQM